MSTLVYSYTIKCFMYQGTLTRTMYQAKFPVLITNISLLSLFHTKNGLMVIIMSMYLCVSLPSNYLIKCQIFMKLGMNTMPSQGTPPLYSEVLVISNTNMETMQTPEVGAPFSVGS
jgi:hypothetical protein